MKKIIKTTLLSVALIGANLLSLEASALAKGMEKCYGVVKAGQNDCAISERRECCYNYVHTLLLVGYG